MPRAGVLGTSAYRFDRRTIPVLFADAAARHQAVGERAARAAGSCVP